MGSRDGLTAMNSNTKSQSLHNQKCSISGQKLLSTHAQVSRTEDQ